MPLTLVRRYLRVPAQVTLPNSSQPDLQSTVHVGRVPSVYWVLGRHGTPREVQVGTLAIIATVLVVPCTRIAGLMQESRFPGFQPGSFFSPPPGREKPAYMYKVSQWPRGPLCGGHEVASWRARSASRWPIGGSGGRSPPENFSGQGL